MDFRSSAPAILTFILSTSSVRFASLYGDLYIERMSATRMRSYSSVYFLREAEDVDEFAVQKCFTVNILVAEVLDYVVAS